MVEMLPLVQIAPEMNLALDPATGSVGASLGKGVVILSMDDINAEIIKIELAANELMESLNPNTSPLGAYPGREGSYVTAGTLTNIVYGFILALIVLIAAMPLFINMGVL